jgi:hypothetical protein
LNCFFFLLCVYFSVHFFFFTCVFTFETVVTWYHLFPNIFFSPQRQQTEWQQWEEDTALKTALWTSEQAQQATWKKTMLATVAASKEKALASQRRLSAALVAAEEGGREREEHHRLEQEAAEARVEVLEAAVQVSGFVLV